MKDILRISFVFLLPIVFSTHVFAQGNSESKLKYEVKRIYPAISISKEKIKELSSINEFRSEVNGQNLSYNPDWVKRFISVEISAAVRGENKTATSKSDIITQEQKDIINAVDAGNKLFIKIDYIPENTLQKNDPKELRFAVFVNPDKSAEFPGGQKALYAYLKEKAITNIPASSFVDYDMASVRFTISEEGEVTQVHSFGQEYGAFKNERIINLLSETIQNMPCWSPAEYADGTKVSQDFVLNVGNMENCIVHTLNIKRD